MPKQPKIYTEPLYVYVRPEVEKFFIAETERLGVSRSFYVNTLLERISKGKIKFAPEKPPTVTDIRRMELERRRKDRERAARNRARRQAEARA